LILNEKSIGILKVLSIPISAEGVKLRPMKFT